MPTPQKTEVVENLTKRIADSTIAVSTDYSGMSVAETNELRKMLRAKDVEYVIVKNTLAYIAADSAEKSKLKDIISGPTGLVFGYGEVVDAVKTLTTFIKDTNSDITIRGALMGERALDIKEIEGEAGTHAVIYADGLSVGQELLYRYFAIEYGDDRSFWCKSKKP